MDVLLQCSESQKFSFNNQDLETVVLTQSFEQICYQCFESMTDGFENYQLFHDQSIHHRAILADTLGYRKPLFAPVMATLQSLASSLTVYQHDWAYYNQIVMSFSAFFQDRIGYYEQIEQQIFVAGARQNLDPNLLPFVSAIMNLWALQEKGPIDDILTIYAKAEVPMPAAISAVIGYCSQKDNAAALSTLGPWLDTLSFQKLDTILDEKIKNNRAITGFYKSAVDSHAKYTLGKQIAQSVAQKSESFYPLFKMIEHIEARLQPHGWEASWEVYPTLVMHGLGLYPNWTVPWMTLCSLPMIISQYRCHERKIAYARAGATL